VGLPTRPIEPEECAMCAKSLLTSAALLLLPAPLLAGGLPVLCVPIDGVTAGNADTCLKLLANGLGEKKAEKVELRENDKQWYALFRFNRDQVPLGELDAVLKGSAFSIPREKLHLFGHVVLEVEIGEAATDKLLTDLKAVRHFKVEETKRDKGVLLVTAMTLYPPHMGHRTDEFGKPSVEKELFGVERSDFAPKADPPANARDLPSYETLRGVVEKNTGSLKGLRWKLLGCHVQGAVAVTDPAEKRK
jgi:hypothetical protein